MPLPISKSCTEPQASPLWLAYRGLPQLPEACVAAHRKKYRGCVCAAVRDGMADAGAAGAAEAVMAGEGEESADSDVHGMVEIARSMRAQQSKQRARRPSLPRYSCSCGVDGARGGEGRQSSCAAAWHACKEGLSAYRVATAGQLGLSREGLRARAEM